MKQIVCTIAAWACLVLLCVVLAIAFTKPVTIESPPPSRFDVERCADRSGE